MEKSATSRRALIHFILSSMMEAKKGMGTVKNEDVIQHDSINEIASIRLEPSSLGILSTDQSISFLCE